MHVAEQRSKFYIDKKMNLKNIDVGQKIFLKVMLETPWVQKGPQNDTCDLWCLNLRYELEDMAIGLAAWPTEPTKDEMYRLHGHWPKRGV
jgi:hypothetical protein